MAAIIGKIAKINPRHTQHHSQGKANSKPARGMAQHTQFQYTSYNQPSYGQTQPTLPQQVQEQYPHEQYPHGQYPQGQHGFARYDQAANTQPSYEQLLGGFAPQHQPPIFSQYGQTSGYPQYEQPHGQQQQAYHPPQQYVQPMHSPTSDMNHQYRANGHRPRGKKQKIRSRPQTPHEFQQPYNAPLPSAHPQTGQGYPQSPFQPPSSCTPPTPLGWSGPFPAPYNPHGSQNQYDQCQPFTPRGRVPVSASSIQWKRPKTPPGSKAPPKTDAAPKTVAASKTDAAPKADAALQNGSKVLGSSVSPALPQIRDAKTVASLVSLTSTLDKLAKMPNATALLPNAKKRKASSSVEPPQPSKPALEGHFPIYLCEDLEGHYDLKDIPKHFCIDEIVWRPGKYLETALPANWELAEQLYKMSEKFVEPKSDPSLHSRETNIEDYYGTIRNTLYWKDMADDPVFQDLSIDIGSIPFTDLHGDYKPVRKVRARYHETAASLPTFEVTKPVSTLDGRSARDDAIQESTNVAFKKPNITWNDGSSPGYESEAMDICTDTPSEALPSIKSTPIQKAASDAQTTEGAQKHDADEEEPYSPPPVSMPLATTEEHVSLAGRQFQDVAMDVAVESIEQTHLIENHSKDLHTRLTPQERPSSTAPKQSDIAPTYRPLPPNVSISQPKTFTPSHALPPKPAQYKFDPNQEEILAKLGVTGGPKPVFNVPGPARTHPPPEHRRSRSRSRSRSATSTKLMQNGFASHHLPLVPPVPPPPPPRKARDATPLSDNPWRAVFGTNGDRGSPRSDGSHRTQAGSDFGPAAEKASVEPPKFERSKVKDEETPFVFPRPGAWEPRAKSATGNAQTANAALKPPIVQGSMPKPDPMGGLRDFQMLKQIPKKPSENIPPAPQRAKASNMRLELPKAEARRSAIKVDTQKKGQSWKAVGTPKTMESSKSVENSKTVGTPKTVETPKTMGTLKLVASAKTAEAPKKVATLKEVETPTKMETPKEQTKAPAQFETPTQEKKAPTLKLKMSKPATKTLKPLSPISEVQEPPSAKKKRARSVSVHSDSEEEEAEAGDEPTKKTDLYAGRLRKRTTKTNPYAHER